MAASRRKKTVFADHRGPDARLSGRAFFVTSHVARGSPSASRARLCHRSPHLGVSRGDLGAHPRCSDTSSAFDKERPLTRPVYLFGLRPLHLCGTRLEGGHQGLSRRYGAVEGEPVRPASSAHAAPGTLGRCGNVCWHPVADHPPRACGRVRADDAAARFGSTHANLTARESLRCPPSRRVPHKWSGRRPYKNTGRAAAFPVRNAEDVSEPRGWAPKALRLTPHASGGASR
jgi:hypothetical protein